MDDASSAQYGTPTPTVTVGQGPPAPHALPQTGYTLALVVLIAVLLIAIGTVVRRAV
jgi:hypothetical protein